MAKVTPFSTHFEVKRECPVLKLSGQLNSTTSPAFRSTVEELFHSGYKSLVLDLTGLEFMDSSGIGVLIFLLRHLQEVGGQQLWAFGCNSQVGTLLSVTHLNTQIRCFGTFAETWEAWMMEQGKHARPAR